jgi:ribonuclease T1
VARRSRGGPAPRLPAWALIAVALAALVAIAAARMSVLGDGGRASPPAGSHERLPPAPVPPVPAPPAPPPADERPPPALAVEGIGDAAERAAIVEVARAIDRGGPFAYRKDGVVFENRERRLPPHPRGHWREYTVPTPGSPDRGARRLVGGADGELFYTRDHYRTFRRIRAPTR